MSLTGTGTAGHGSALSWPIDALPTAPSFWPWPWWTPWRGEGEELAEADLAARAEPFSLDKIPAEVLALTAGVDVQHDRLELTFTDWTEAGQMLVLDHRVIWGGHEDPETWHALDDLLRTRWPHELGGRLALDACAVDAGDGASMAQVLAFTTPRLRARIVVIKGASGMARPIIENRPRAARRARPGPYGSSESMPPKPSHSQSWRSPARFGSANACPICITSN